MRTGGLEVEFPLRGDIAPKETIPARAYLCIVTVAFAFAEFKRTADDHSRENRASNVAAIKEKRWCVLRSREYFYRAPSGSLLRGVHNAPLSFVLCCRSDDIQDRVECEIKTPTKRSILFG